MERTSMQGKKSLLVVRVSYHNIWHANLSMSDMLAYGHLSLSVCI